ncbi:hypothetical protein KEM56_005174 [Ascosphaera pollenicola]|nr:hypothetical protein KEM56_005174 [Ascosphaera pollenicola]
MPLKAKIQFPGIRMAGKTTTFADHGDVQLRGPQMATEAAPIPRELPGDNKDDVLFTPLFGVRHVELNRPEKLNALDASMARKITPRLLEFENSDIANVVVVSGAGERAFCAGGDVSALALGIRDGGEEGKKRAKEYFTLEYQLDHLIAHYTKPYIAVLDGFTMGGGVGLSVHAPFRIATEKTKFAMPETKIGFFPDVGASFFLPRLDGALGTYLALTSEILTAEEVFYAGVATHYTNSSTLAALVQRLSELVFHDRATLDERLDIVNKTMAEFHTGFPDDTGKPSVVRGSLRNSVDRCFSKTSVSEIIEALNNETENPEWAQKTLKTLSERSPTSLKVALRSMVIGKRWSITTAFQREQKLSAKFMEHPDFVNGVCALLVDKTGAPTWQPATLDQVTDQDVDKFFEIPEGEKLMPVLRPGVDYDEYPHKRFALPSEEDIKKFVMDTGYPKEDVVRHFWNATNRKAGVRTKVAEVLERKTKEGLKGRLEWVDITGDATANI